MRGYSRRLDFLELNPIVDLRRDNEVDYSSHIITKKKQTVRVPQNEIDPIIGQDFYGRGRCDSRDYGDPHRLSRPVTDSRHDTDTTEPNSPRVIYFAR